MSQKTTRSASPLIAEARRLAAAAYAESHRVLAAHRADRAAARAASRRVIEQTRTLRQRADVERADRLGRVA